jgi:hypothetical protein
MKWIGQHIYDQVSKFRNTVDFSDTVNFSEHVTFYQPVNDADPTISLGASDAERLRIGVFYQGSASTLAQIIQFATSTESSTADDGRFVFAVDGVSILDIDDDGIDFRVGMGIAINGTDILTDSSGTATLSNIDALDATTIATFNAALTAGDITGVTAGTGLSGGGSSGAVTLSVDASQPSITTLAGVTAIGTAGNPLTVTSDQVIFASAAASDPLVNIQNTANDASAPRLRFTKNRGGDAVDNDNVGEISFHSYDDGTPSTQEYARIKAQVHDATSDEESGSLKLMVANHDGGVQAGLSIVGGDVDSEIDVNLGLGAASTTTVAGTLTMGSTATLNNTGILQTAAQTNITSLGTLSSLAVTSDAGLGSAAMTLTNADVDQIALDINASNTTGNIIDINAQALTTGSAIYIDCNSLGNSPTIHLDVDDAGTTTASRILHYIDYDKSSNTPNTIANSVTGSAVHLNDNATGNHAGSTRILTGHDSQIGVLNENGTEVISGHRSIITNGTPLLVPGGIQSYFSAITNGYGVDFKSISSANNGDYFSIETTTNGATTLTTVDADAALAHFEIAADGNITLDAAGDIALEAGGNDVTVDTDTFSIQSSSAHLPTLEIKSIEDGADGGHLKFHKDRGAAQVNDDIIGTISWQGDNDAEEPINYGQIEVSALEVDDTDEAGRMRLMVAESNGSATGLTTGLLIEGSDNTTDGEVNVTIAAGAASTTTVAGNLKVTTGIELSHDSDTTIARASAGVVTIEGVNIAMQSLRIKLIPSAFMADDGGRPLLLDDTGQASENFFIESNSSDTVYASVDIPTGYKATHIMVHGSATDAIECWEMQINSKTGVSKGTGNVDTEINITDVTSSTTNYLLIQVANASGNEIHGGYVTIAVA